VNCVLRAMLLTTTATAASTVEGVAVAAVAEAGAMQVMLCTDA
jgi:hypothetical protein